MFDHSTCSGRGWREPAGSLGAVGGAAPVRPPVVDPDWSRWLTHSRPALLTQTKVESVKPNADGSYGLAAANAG